MLGSSWPHHFQWACQAKYAKNGTSGIIPGPRELDPQTYIYLESVPSGKHFKYIYMAISLPVFT